MRRNVAVLLVMGASWACLSSPAQAQQATGGSTLAAVGEGHVFRTPDQAELSVTVRKLRATSAAARGAANREVAAIRRTLRGHGVPAGDVQTTAVSVSRERVRRRGHPTRTRYRAFTELEIRSRDIAHLGALFDALAAAGADDVIGPDFSFADPSAAQIVATRRAIADARRRADDAAAQLGSHVTGIASVDLAPSLGGGVVSSGDSGSSAGGSGTRLSPGRDEISAIVRVVYTLGA
jgi:uncharacterized protein YggE